MCQIDEKTVRKIQTYYNPKLLGTQLIFDADGSKRSVSSGSDKPLYLSFGEATSKEEALKTTPLAVTKALFPDEWETRLKGHYGDKRLEKYIAEIKENIGFIEYKGGHEELTLTNPIKVDINPIHGVSEADLGTDNKGNWIIQFGVRTAIDDYSIDKYYFSKKPSYDDFRTARKIFEFDLHLRLYGFDEATFHCWECGAKTYFLDLEGDFLEKLELFEGKYCGC